MAKYEYRPPPSTVRYEYSYGHQRRRRVARCAAATLLACCCCCCAALQWKHSGHATRYWLLGTRVGQAHEHVRLQSNHEYVSLKPVPHEKVGCPTRKLAFCSKLATRSRRLAAAPTRVECDHVACRGRSVAASDISIAMFVERDDEIFIPYLPQQEF